MKKILGLLVIVLGLTGCSMNVAPTEEKSNIEWVSNIESRADEVTIEVYRVPMENTMNNGKEYQYTKNYTVVKSLEWKQAKTITMNTILVYVL